MNESTKSNDSINKLIEAAEFVIRESRSVSESKSKASFRRSLQQLQDAINVAKETAES